MFPETAHVHTYLDLRSDLQSGARRLLGNPAQIRYITDSQGRALILHGTNTSSSAKNPATGHMPWIEERHVEQETTEWGFNFARFLIFWDGIEPQRGVYDDAYLDEVARRVEWYTSRGAWVMLDMHQDMYSHAPRGHHARQRRTRWLGVRGPVAARGHMTLQGLLISHGPTLRYRHRLAARRLT